MKVFHYEINLFSKYDNLYKKVKGFVIANNIVGATTKLNEYYVDNNNTIVTLKLIEGKSIYELSCEEL